MGLMTPEEDTIKRLRQLLARETSDCAMYITRAVNAENEREVLRDSLGRLAIDNERKDSRIFEQEAAITRLRTLLVKALGTIEGSDEMDEEAYDDFIDELRKEVKQ